MDEVVDHPRDRAGRVLVKQRDTHSVIEHSQASGVDLRPDRLVVAADERPDTARIARHAVKLRDAVSELDHPLSRRVLGRQLFARNQLPGPDRPPVRER